MSYILVRYPKKNAICTFSDNQWISCRDVLWVLVFCGFGVNYMLRNNLNLAIVAMVPPRERSAAASECVQEHLSSNVTREYHDYSTSTVARYTTANATTVNSAVVM